MTPTARALAARLLGRPRVIKRALGRPPAVALTFDDGPSPWTAEIAAALEAHDCRGTFFLLGSAVRERPEAVAALAAGGHELGNHLWSHTDPERQSRGELRAEIDRAAAAIGAAAGRTPLLVRPPYCGAPQAVARAARGGPTTFVVLRSVDPADWQAETAAQIVEPVLAQVGPGDIVCLHDGISPNNSGTDTRAATVEAVSQLVPALLERGWRPVTVSELLA